VPYAELGVGSTPTTAIAGVSYVAFWTPRKYPDDSTYWIEFGDGEGSVMGEPFGPISLERAWHTYKSAGEFKARLTVYDSAGFSLAAGSASVAVRSLEGRWTNDALNPTTNKRESRAFEWSPTIYYGRFNGSYVGPDGAMRRVVGVFTDDSLRLTNSDDATTTYFDIRFADDVSAFTVWPWGPYGGEKLALDKTLVFRRLP